MTGTSIARAGIRLDGRNEVVLEFAVPGWGWQVTDGGGGPGFGVVRCRVTGRTDVPVRIWAAGWPGVVQRTGSKLEYGSDVCEFSPLGAGGYKVQPEGIAAVADVPVDGSRAVWVTFTEIAADEPAPIPASALLGHLREVDATPCAGRRVQVFARQGAAGRGRAGTVAPGPRETETAIDGSFRFAGLPAGIYRLEIDGTGVAKEGILLDGANTVAVELTLPAERGEVAGDVTDPQGQRTVGRVVRLLTAPAAAPFAEVETDAQGRYRFDRLAAGTYTVQVMASDPAAGVAAQRADATVTGAAAVEIDLLLPDAQPAPPAWRATLEAGGVGSGFSVVRCQIVGEPDPRSPVVDIGLVGPHPTYWQQTGIWRRRLRVRAARPWPLQRRAGRPGGPPRRTAHRVRAAA